MVELPPNRMADFCRDQNRDSGFQIGEAPNLEPGIGHLEYQEIPARRFDDDFIIRRQGRPE